MALGGVACWVWLVSCPAVCGSTVGDNRVGGPSSGMPTALNGNSAFYLCWPCFLLGVGDQGIGSGGRTLSPVSKENTVKRKLSSVAGHGCFVFFSKPWLIDYVDDLSTALALGQLPL